MNFEVGKTYGGYTIEARTACFVTIGGARKKISVSADGIEEVSIDGTKIAAFVEPETFFIPVVAHYDNRDAHNLPADVAHEMATPYSAPAVDFDEVETMAASLGYQILNMGTLKKPMYRLMRDGLLVASHLYGGGLALFDVRAYLEAERHSLRYDIHVPSALERQYSRSMGCTVTAVVRNVSQCGYEPAIPMNPSWFYDDDDRAIDLDLERQRIQEMFDRDCDQAANFSMSAYRGTCGGMV